MSHVILDRKLVASLRGARQPMELHDEAGNFLGRFIPASAEPRISEEELKRRESAGGGRPLTAILSDLEKTR